MKKIFLLIIILTTYSCKNDKTDDFILEDEFADFVSPYKDKPGCDSEAENKLINFSKNEFMDFPYESARYIRNTRFPLRLEAETMRSKTVVWKAT
mgnify:CR=1 FL=1